MGSPYQDTQWVLDQIIETISNPANPAAYDIYIDILAQNQAYEQNPYSAQWIHGPPASLEDWAAWAATTAIHQGANVGNILTIALDVLLAGYYREKQHAESRNQHAGGKSKKRRSKKRRSKKNRSKKSRSKKRRSRKNRS